MKKQKRIYGAGLKNRMLTMSDEDRQLLAGLGNGNASQGLRVLIEKYRKESVK